MGNASRVAAIIEQLGKDPSLHLTVATWGKGEEYLREFQKKSKIEFTFLPLYPYSAPSGWPKILRPAYYVLAYLRNSKRLFVSARSLRPDRVLLDSDYHFFPFLLLGARIYFLGQTGFVLDSQKRMALPLSWRERFTFFIRERLDFLVQRFLSHRILAPVISSGPEESNKYTPVPLVVKAGLSHSGSNGNFFHEFSVILSGSGIQSSNLERFAEKNHIPILRQVPIGKEQLESSRYFFIQGGFSSISEMLACGKKFVVVPMDNHPEQKINAEVVRRSGRGLSLKADLLPELDLEKLKHELHSLPDATPSDFRGAEFVAGILKGANE